MGGSKWSSELSSWNVLLFLNSSHERAAPGGKHGTITSWGEEGNTEQAPESLLSRATPDTQLPPPCHKWPCAHRHTVSKEEEQQGPGPTWQGVGDGKDRVSSSLSWNLWVTRAGLCPSWATQGEQEWCLEHGEQRVPATCQGRSCEHCREISRCPVETGGLRLPPGHNFLWGSISTVYVALTSPIRQSAVSWAGNACNNPLPGGEMDEVSLDTRTLSHEDVCSSLRSASLTFTHGAALPFGHVVPLAVQLPALGSEADGDAPLASAEPTLVQAKHVPVVIFHVVEHAGWLCFWREFKQTRPTQRPLRAGFFYVSQTALGKSVS